MRGLETEGDPNLLVGFGTSDDAGVYLLQDQTALVQTVDFITPVVDDPEVFGQVAAAGALGTAAVALAAALVTFGYIVSVAMTRDSRGFIIWL